MSKTFKIRAAQGEIQITKIDALPAGVKPVKAEAGRFIVGHSETGHHHVLAERGATVMEAERAPEGMRVLYAILNAANELTHLRPHDTHGTITMEPGVYELRITREYDPFEKLARQQAD
jgi:hypothetical protein